MPCLKREDIPGGVREGRASNEAGLWGEGFSGRVFRGWGWKIRHVFLAVSLLPAVILFFLLPVRALAEEALAEEVVEQQSRVVVFGGDYKYPPFSFLDKRGQPAGYNIEVILAIGVVMGFEVNFQLGPWEGISKALDEKLIDAAAEFSSTEREEELLFSEPLMIRYYIIVIRKSEAIFTTLEDLRGKEVIVRAGSYTQIHIEDTDRGMTLIPVETEVDVLRLLASGQHDCAIVGNISCEFLVRRHNLKNLVISGPPVIARRYSIAVPRDNTALLEDINEGLAIIRQTGQYEAIYDKWIGTIEHGIPLEVILKYAVLVLVPLVIILTGVLMWSVVLKRQVRLRTAELSREISDRKAAERQLEMLSRAVSEASNGIIMTECEEKDNPIIYVNSAFENITGYSASEATGRDCRFLQGEDRDQPALEEVREAISASMSCRVVLRNYRKDGQMFWNELNISPVKDEDGRVTHHIGIMTDITHRKQAIDALRESELCYRAVVEDQTELITRYKKDMTLTFVNHMCCRFTGKDAEELRGCRFLEFIPAEEREYIEKQIASLGQKRQACVVEHHIRRADGELRLFQWTNRVIFDEQGELVEYQGIGRDVTEQRQAEQEVAMLAKFPDENPNPVVRVSGDREVLYSNRAAQKKLELSAGRSLPKNWYLWIDEALKSDRVCQYDIEYGESFFTLVFAPVVGENYVNVYGMDITDRKRAENGLKDSEEKYRQLVETMNEGMGMADENFVFTYVNNKLCDMLGYSKQELEGHGILEFIHEDNKSVMEKEMAKRKKGSISMYEVAWKTKDGRKLHMLVSPMAFFDNQGRFKGSLGVHMDITRRKETEIERRKLLGVLALKNKELESILYIASHDLRSPLVNIQGFSYELARNCDVISNALREKELSSKAGKDVHDALNEGVPEAINYILASAGKMDLLLLGLLRLSRLGRSALNIEHLEMNALLKEVVENAEYQVKEAAVTVDLELVPDCQGDYVQIGQVFSNLLDNAIKYLDDSRAGMIRIYGKQKAGRSIYCVEDNGVGIDVDHQGKIFETFHRLDPLKTGGEGLGLTIVRGIIERHEGKVWVESERGRGSKFFVSLPGV